MLVEEGDPVKPHPDVPFQVEQRATSDRGCSAAPPSLRPAGSVGVSMGKRAIGVGVSQLTDGCLIHPDSAQLGQELLGKIGVGSGHTWIGRIIPASVVTQQQVITQAGVQYTLDALQVALIILIANCVVLQPRPAPGHLQVPAEVRLNLGVDPDESFRRIPHRLDDVELILDNPAQLRVAPDNGIGLPAGRGSRT